jgi:hypothetical protein
MILIIFTWWTNRITMMFAALAKMTGEKRKFKFILNELFPMKRRCAWPFYGNNGKWLNIYNMRRRTYNYSWKLLSTPNYIAAPIITNIPLYSHFNTVLCINTFMSKNNDIIMKSAALLRKILYLSLPTHGWLDPMDVLPQTVKKNDWLYYWLLLYCWNDKTASMQIYLKEVNPEKKTIWFNIIIQILK